MSNKKDDKICKIWRKDLSRFEDDDHRNLASWSKSDSQRLQEVLFAPLQILPPTRRSLPMSKPPRLPF